MGHSLLEDCVDRETGELFPLTIVTDKAVHEVVELAPRGKSRDDPFVVTDAGFEFGEPWMPIADDAERTRSEAELRREAPVGHPLFGLAVRGIARRQDRDDWLFALDAGGWAVVHLTWQQETDPRWPATALLATQGEVEARIGQDVFEFG